MEENYSDINWLNENKEEIEKIINGTIDENSHSNKQADILMSRINIEWLRENKDILEKLIDKKPKFIHAIRLGYDWLKNNKEILKKFIIKYKEYFQPSIIGMNELKKIGFDWLMQNKEFTVEIINNTEYKENASKFIKSFDNEWLKNNTDILECIINRFGKSISEVIEEKLGDEWLRNNPELIEKTINKWNINNLINLIGKETLQSKKELVENIIFGNTPYNVYKFVNKLDKEWLQENKDIIKKVINKINSSFMPELIQKIGGDYLEENVDILKEILYECDYLIIPTLIENLDGDKLYKNIEEMEFEQRDNYSPKKENLLVHLSIILEKSNKNWFDSNTDIIKEVINECDNRGHLLILMENINKEWLKENTDVACYILNEINRDDTFENVKKLDKKILLSDDVLNVIRERLSPSASNEDVKFVIENDRIDIFENEYQNYDSLVVPNYVKFKRLHNFEPAYEVLKKYPTDKIEKFNKKTWFSVAKHNIFQQSSESKNSLVEMSQLFGIFENDDKVQNRIQKIHEIATYLPKDISNDEMPIDTVILKGYKHVTDIVRYYKVLNLDDIDLTNELTHGTRAENIESELKFIKDRLRDTITESEYQNLRKISERNVLLRKVLDKMYEKQEVSGLRLEKAPLNEKELNELQEKLEKVGVKDVITANKLHNIFDGSTMEYNPNFYNFIEENLEEIIKNPLLGGKLSSISREYSNIQKIYGVKNITIEHCLRYYDEIQYEDIGEEYDLAKVCKYNGVSQSDFDELKKIYTKQKERKINSIPEQNIGNKNEVRGVTLRLDDPRALVIGMPLMTNCCQKLHDAGQACMIHSATSKDGRIFVVLDEEDNILMQSWMWMSKDGKTICYDNPESSLYYDKNRKKYEEKVVEVYKKHAEGLIKKQNDRIEKEKQKKIKDANLTNKKKIEEQYENLKVEQVTMGIGYADAIDLDKYFKKIEQNESIKPDKYEGYRDSHTQVLVAGKENIERKEIVTSEEREKMQQVFEDKNIVERKTGYKISKKDIEKIKDLESNVHKQSMVLYEDVKDVEDLADLYNESEKDMKIRYGKSWYTVYSDSENGIHIYDLAKQKDAEISADIEMMEELGSIIAETISEDGDTRNIEAELREDTSYIIYLKLLEKGLVEQIGNDILYTFENEEIEDGRNFTKEEQEEILKNKNNANSQEKTKSTNMHRIVFKPTEEYLKSKLYKNIQDKRKKEAEYGWEI